MTASTSLLSRQGHRLLQIGVALILFSAFEGFAIPLLASPRIGLSAHTLSGFQGALLLAFGLIWPKLELSVATAWAAFWCLIYSALAILAAYVVAGFLGVGIETIALTGELPHGLARGSAARETIIKILAYSSAPPGLAAFVLILWGLRGRAGEPA